MQRSPFAPALTEDELADLAVRRGRNVGGVWIIASLAVFGLGLVSTSVFQLVVTWLVGVSVFVIGLAVRSRYWRSIRRQLGDATVQRAEWRRAASDGVGQYRIVAAVALVALFMAFELWRP